MAALTGTSTTSPRTGTSWLSPDTDIGSAEELELSARAQKACRRIDEIRIEKQANKNWYCEQTDPLWAQHEAEKDQIKQEILYRKMNEVMDTYFRVNDALNAEEAALHKISCADIHAVQQQINAEEAEFGGVDVKVRCKKLKALLKQRTISESDALQNEAENLLAKAKNAKTVQKLQALVPAINDMICSLQANKEI